jgi:hypothetical protein
MPIMAGAFAVTYPAGMDYSFLPAYAVFSSIALAVALAYLSLCSLAMLTSRVVQHFRPARPASCRPGEIIHQALRITGRRAEQFRTATLVFAVAMLMLTAFGRLGWWPEAQLWIFVAIAVVATGLQLFGMAKLVQLARYRLRLSGLLDKHVSMARRLAEAQLRGNRVYHSVRVGDAIIDNVIVGPNGVYAIGMFPAPVANCESVSLVSGELVFEPGGIRVSLQQYRRAVRTLSKSLGGGIGSKVIALPVIVVPDCVIASSHETLPMLVSLESCMSFIGWKETRAFLMDDEVDSINRWLDRHALEAPHGSMRAVTGYLDRRVARPALV